MNNTEKWKIINNTGIAHPIHIHDMSFYLLNINGGIVPAYQRGKKDVVLVMPGQYVEFVTRFEDFSDNVIPYMYHCHLLPHEDDGMMGSFRVIDTTAVGITSLKNNDFTFNPNPFTSKLSISFQNQFQNADIRILNFLGEEVRHENINDAEIVNIDLSDINPGIYFLEISTLANGNTRKFTTHKIIKQ